MIKKIRENWIACIFILFAISLIVFSKSNIPAAKEGIDLWVSSVIPALFPFFVATELLSHTNIISFIGKLFNKFMRPIFNVPGEGAYALVMGIISGYPVGAKIVTNFRLQGVCNKVEAERLLTFTNNSGPLFILGTVGISLFRDTTTGIVLLITHILSCITVGIIFRFWKISKNYNYEVKQLDNKNKITDINTPVKLSNLGEIISTSIHNAIITTVQIGGFVILFSVIISILKNSSILGSLSTLLSPIFNLFHIPSDFINGFISGIIELTNGVKNICSITFKEISVNIILVSFLLGFGGFSVLLQVNFIFVNMNL